MAGPQIAKFSALWFVGTTAIMLILFGKANFFVCPLHPEKF